MKLLAAAAVIALLIAVFAPEWIVPIRLVAQHFIVAVLTPAITAWTR